MASVPHSSRPTYQGKTVTEWALLAYSGDGRAALELKALGSNVVPELVQMLDAKDPVIEKEMWDLQPKIPHPFRSMAHVKAPQAAAMRGAGARSLGILGPAAGAAVAALGKALCGNDHQLRWDASAALGRIGKKSVPVLTEALKGQDPDVRRASVYALAEIGTQAEASLPTLAKLLNDPDANVRAAAAYSMHQITGPHILAN